VHTKESNEPIEVASRESILLEVAETLKEQREQRRLSIEDVAKALNLREAYIKDLENGDWSNMPGEVYALGFLRQYAAFLNVDLSNSIENIKSVQYQLTKPLTFPDPAISPSKTWMLIAIISFALLLIFFNIFDRNPAPLPSQLMQQSANNMIQQNKSNVQDKVQQSSPIVAPTSTIQTKPNNNAPSREKDIKTEESSTQKNAAVKQQNNEYQYQLTAVTSDVWLQLHDSHEPPVLVREVLLKKGETMKVKHDSALSLTSGNPLSLAIYLNNQQIIQVGELGELGKVLHKHPLQITKTTP